MTDDEREVEEYIKELGEKYASQQGNFPEPPNKDTLLVFMRDVVKEAEPIKLSKTANFREEEVGKPKAPVLTYLNIAAYAESEGYDIVANYLRNKVGLISSISLGRKAKLIETLFTVRRETKNLGTPKITTKKGLFSGETTTKEGMET